MKSPTEQKLEEEIKQIQQFKHYENDCYELFNEKQLEIISKIIDWHIEYVESYNTSSDINLIIEALQTKEDLLESELKGYQLAKSELLKEVGKRLKEEVMDFYMNNKDVDTIVSAFVEYLKKQNKLNLMPSIVKQMQSLVKGDLQKGHIISAIPMDEKNIREIENKLSLKFASTIELVNTVDPSIIGGIIIKFGDVVIDESVRTRLHTLEQTIYGS